MSIDPWRRSDADVHVTASGDDASGDGSSGRPFATLQRAQARVRTLARDRADIVVELGAGTYRIDDTLRFGPEDGGAGEHFVIYRGRRGASVVISGGVELPPWDASSEAGVWSTAAPDHLFRQLYVDGAPAVRARHPNVGAFHRLVGWDADNEEDPTTDSLGRRGLLVPGAVGDTLAAMSPFELSEVEIVVQRVWTVHRLRIARLAEHAHESALVIPQEPERSRSFWQPWPVRAPGQAFHLENARVFLDAEDEWYCDRSTGVLLYVPPGGAVAAGPTEAAIVPRLETLLDVRGTRANPVRNLVIAGISFQHAGWTEPSFEGFVDVHANHRVRSHAREHQLPRNTVESLSPLPAAITLRGVSGVHLVDNEIRNVGADAIAVLPHATDVHIERNTIKDVAGSGISIDSEIGRYDPSEHDCAAIAVTGNTICRVGTEYAGGVAIFAGYPAGMTIADNEISDVPYSAINVGWVGAGSRASSLRDARITGNRIRRAMTLLEDGAAIYVGGRQSPGDRRNGTHIEHNVISEITRSEWASARCPVTGVFLDNAASGVTVAENTLRAIDEIPEWLTEWGWSTTAVGDCRGIFQTPGQPGADHSPPATDNEFVGNVYVSPGQDTGGVSGDG